MKFRFELRLKIILSLFFKINSIGQASHANLLSPYDPSSYLVPTNRTASRLKWRDVGSLWKYFKSKSLLRPTATSYFSFTWLQAWSSPHLTHPLGLLPIIFGHLSTECHLEATFISFHHSRNLGWQRFVETRTCTRCQGTADSLQKSTSPLVCQNQPYIFYQSKNLSWCTSQHHRHQKSTHSSNSWCSTL